MTADVVPRMEAASPALNLPSAAKLRPSPAVPGSMESAIKMWLQVGNVQKLQQVSLHEPNIFICLNHPGLTNKKAILTITSDYASSGFATWRRGPIGVFCHFGNFLAIWRFWQLFGNFFGPFDPWTICDNSLQ